MHITLESYVSVSRNLDTPYGRKYRCPFNDITWNHSELSPLVRIYYPVTSDLVDTGILEVLSDCNRLHRNRSECILDQVVGNRRWRLTGFGNGCRRPLQFFRGLYMSSPIIQNGKSPRDQSLKSQNFQFERFQWLHGISLKYCAVPEQ